MTHDDLVKIAATWLQRDRNPVVITDLVTSGSETADAIGFNHGGVSTLLECKVSRTDFLRDKKKLFRKYPEYGLGRFRYYVVPQDLIIRDELPEGWGLIVVNEKGKTRRIVDATHQKTNDLSKRREIALLVSAMRRMISDAKGISVKVYTINNKTRSTIGVEPETSELHFKEKTMGKKKAGKKKVENLGEDKAEKTEKTEKRARQSGGFGVYEKMDADPAVAEKLFVSSSATNLCEIVTDLNDTGAALRWIKENAETWEGKTLVIAQVKQTISIKVEKVTRVTFEEA